jgi:hypothetical protein
MEFVEQEGLLFFGSGLTDPDLSLAASLALFGAFELRHPAALNGPQFLSTSILRQPLAVRVGYLAIPKLVTEDVRRQERAERRDRRTKTPRQPGRRSFIPYTDTGKERSF